MPWLPEIWEVLGSNAKFTQLLTSTLYDVIKWKRFSCYCPSVRSIHRSPVHTPHKDQWRGALTCSLICAWINGWVNNRYAGDFRRRCARHYVTVIEHLAVLCTQGLPMKLAWFPQLIVHQKNITYIDPYLLTIEHCISHAFSSIRMVTGAVSHMIFLKPYPWYKFKDCILHVLWINASWCLL